MDNHNEKKILVIDDDDATYRILEDSLGELWVTRAKTLGEAEDIYERYPEINLIVIRAEFCIHTGTDLTERFVEQLRETGYKYPILCYFSNEKDKRKLSATRIATHQTQDWDVANFTKVIIVIEERVRHTFSQDRRIQAAQSIELLHRAIE